MTIDFKALAAKAVETGADQTKSVAGGGERELPQAGPALCRLIAYVETGKQTKTFKGAAKVIDEVKLIFELVGKRHPPIEMSDGTKMPHRVTVTESLSLNEKANYFKLFNRMNYKQTARHMAELLGEGFKCEVFHDKWVGKDGKERVDISLRNEAGYSILPPRKEDEDSDTGWVDIAVPPATTPIKAFIWSIADLDQWGSIFIEGEYPERKDDKGVVVAKAKTKNIFQSRIIGAKNFDGSPIQVLLAANGLKLDLPDVGEEDEGNDRSSGASGTPEPSPAAAKSSTTSPSNDALGGIV